jgi:hypothetical protein
MLCSFTVSNSPCGSATTGSTAPLLVVIGPGATIMGIERSPLLAGFGPWFFALDAPPWLCISGKYF